MAQAAVAKPVQIESDLARAQAGDSEAFAEILRGHQAMVFSLARHVLRDPASAEELAQDVFVSLYRNLRQIESAEHLKFWLRRVTSHRCIDVCRRKAHRRECSIDDVTEPAVASGPSDLLLSDRIRRLMAE